MNYTRQTPSEPKSKKILQSLQIYLVKFNISEALFKVYPRAFPFKLF